MTDTFGQMKIRAFQLRCQIRVVELEAKGMNRRGPSLTSKLKTFYGLPRNSSRDDLLASLRDDLANADEMLLKLAEPSTCVN